MRKEYMPYKIKGKKDVVDFGSMEAIEQYIAQHITISGVEYEPDEENGYICITFEADPDMPMLFFAGDSDNETVLTIDIDE